MWVDALWSREAGAGSAIHVLPDGCIDLIFSEGRLFTSPLIETAEHFPAGVHPWFVGARFRPAMASMVRPGCTAAANAPG